MSDFLDNMQLPNRNEKEELEELSKMKLLPLFDLNLFQIREEEYRDKGVDLDFELKFKDKYTNFRFLVQMKATNTLIKNRDNSFSKSIDTSNIQYLVITVRFVPPISVGLCHPFRFKPCHFF